MQLTRTDLAKYVLGSRILPWINSGELYEFATLLQLSQRLTERADAPPPIGAEKVAQLSLDFHQRAGTLTDQVARTISRFASGVPTIRVSHQPNFLPSLNVALQPTLLNDLGAHISNAPAEIFLLLDYDVASDRRFRHSLFPSLSLRAGYYSTSLGPLKDSSSLLMYAEPKPKQESIKLAYSKIRQLTSQDAGSDSQAGIWFTPNFPANARGTRFSTHDVVRFVQSKYRPC